MTTDHRNGRRRVVRQRARIVLADGSLLGLCRICDISTSGACLEFARADAVPDNFILLLSYDRRLRRQCSVVWRSDNSVGVEYIRDCPMATSSKRRQPSTLL